jgi:chitin disaccharide deacetylase
MESILLEKVVPDEGLSFVFTHNKAAGLCRSNFWHCHSEYELVYIPHGHGTRYVGSQPTRFEDGDLVLLGPNIPHNSFDFGYERDDYEEYVVQFDGKALEHSLFPHFREFGAIARLLEDARTGLAIEGSQKHVIGKKMMEMSGAVPLTMLLKLFELLDLTAAVAAATTAAAAAAPHQIDLHASTLLLVPVVNTERLQQVFEHIADHFHRDITTRETADLLAMTDASFCRFFSRNTGKTFKSALTEYRIHKACGWLINSSLPVNIIATKCGYNNVSLFNRFFRRIMETSPLEYRSRFQNKILLSVLLLVFFMQGIFAQTPKPVAAGQTSIAAGQTPVGAIAAPSPTYAERLGYPKGARVLILHVDDAGMSLESNEGAINAITKGAANSVSVMMPCPWVPGFVQWLKQHPNTDAGLHLTLTSEWNDYRWIPLSGRSKVPGLVDSSGCFWPGVAQVAAHASAGEVELEMTAQLDRARSMGFQPTHLDTHMGTVYATPEFLKRYMQLGMKNHIPVMLPGGQDKLIQQEMMLPDGQVRQFRQLGQTLWDAGLPVLDDLHNFSYDWKVPDSVASDDKKLDDYRTAKYVDALTKLQPGVTMMIMHCSNASEHFTHISDSGPLRRGDMLAMMNPAFKKALKEQGIILTTWRELMERRTAAH